MAEYGIRTAGVDPTVALVREARIRDPDGEYLVGRAEDLAFDDGRFDLVVSCLSLIDIPDIVRAISEMNRVLKPGGTLLVANLTGFTSSCESGWVRRDGKAVHFPVDNYLEERWNWVSWRGIRIRNWHRPLSACMAQFLQHGLTLGYFDEPAPVAGEPAKADRYRRVPYYVIMEWKKASTAIVP